MKKVYVIGIMILFLLQSKVEAQYNTHMAGNFNQNDSCTGYVYPLNSAVQITASVLNSSDIIIHNFSSLYGYNVTATLDSINHTVTIPSQTQGSATIWGNGTFTSNYSSMILNFNIDFGSVISCIDKYSRVVGINEAIENIPFKIFPNPANNLITISNKDLLKIKNISFSNCIGQEVLIKSFEDENFKADVAFDLKSLPQGLYIVHIVAANDVNIRQKIIVLH